MTGWRIGYACGPADIIEAMMKIHQYSMLCASIMSQQLSTKPNNKPLLRILFEGEGATIPFISQTSRELHLDINILLANLDRFDTVTCGVLVIELTATPALLEQFIERANQFHLSVEMLGYVTNDVL